jgi:hypothetical protein
VRRDRNARRVRVVDSVADKPRAVGGVDHYPGRLHVIEHCALYDCSESRRELVCVERKWQMLEHPPRVATRHYVSVPLSGGEHTHLAADGARDRNGDLADERPKAVVR